MFKYFGTDGIRGEVPSMINQKLLHSIGYAVSKILPANAAVLVGRDTRKTGKMLRDALIQSINRFAPSCKVFDAGIASTPCISYLTQNGEFGLGIMLTASHNPEKYNGIKFFNSFGEKIDDETQAEIEHFMESYEDEHQFDNPQTSVYPIDTYLDLLASLVLQKPDLKILFDTANGATTNIIKQVCKSAGVNATFVNDNIEDEINKDSGCLDHKLFSSMVKNKYDLGVAFDGDGDRIIVCTRHGEVLDGDSILEVLASYYKITDDLKHVVLTVQSNFGLLKKLKGMGIETTIVDVGDKNIATALKEKDLFLGAEQSGHIIVKKYSNSGDGILTSLLLLRAIDYLKINLENYRFFKKFKQKQVSINCKDKTALKTYLIQQLRGDIEELVKSGGRVIIRESGTEPLVRVLIESPSKKNCLSILSKIYKANENFNIG